ncbi:hemin uptake protein HemP [Rivibacter subsaxonicus]|uniref:Hemin uptake protein HemP n=1 Tax=Rivibacter subsaxonicus TaxID=457575 RepID=A0A4Q7VPB3_9BURK|nr:hemin uptake protein HemP [Rivibacter subsaxonicus]RZT98027.1 hemin uptake protein HemP [Rivibacter subsaxonicus]
MSAANFEALAPATANAPCETPPLSHLDGAADLAWGCVVRSDELMHGRPVLHIEHNGALYQLRATRLGKLILTK